MAALSKLQLKQLWKAYFQPTSADFSNLIDSWTDYSPALEAVGAAVSGGSTGVVNVTSPSTIAFLTSGATGQAVLATGTAASARTVLGLTAGATGQEILAAGTQASARSAIGLPLPVSIANGGTSAADAATARINLGVADATESAPGRIEIATQVEANAGTDDTRALTPLKLANISPASVTRDAADEVLILDASDSNKLKRAGVLPGSVLQVVSYATSSRVSGSTSMPYDDTIPQITEGAEFLSVSITPKSSSSRLRIDVSCWLVDPGGNFVNGAIFRAGVNDALAVSAITCAALYPEQFVMSHVENSPGTSSYTFSFRAGANNSGQTQYMNGDGTGRKFGGKASSTIIITEIAT